MGCAGSKGDDGRRNRRLHEIFSVPSPRLSEADQKLTASLKALKLQMDEEQNVSEAFSFTKIILKLGTIERVLKRVKAVFRSVDHGNKGHVTMQELKEGLLKAKIDLGDEWHDTDIDECLEHLGGAIAGSSHDGADRIGLRGFVVMLAVGRVCRPLRRRSTVFAPFKETEEEENDAAADLERDSYTSSGDNNAHRVMMLTIEEHKDEHSPSIKASQSTVDDDNVTPTIAVAIAGKGKGGAVGVTTGGKEKEARTNLEDAAERTKAGTGERQPMGSAEPGGPPNGNISKSFKWARIPSLQNLDLTERSPHVSSDTTVNMTKARSTGHSGEGELPGGGSPRSKKLVGNESNVVHSVNYVLDLFITAYFQFDTKGEGYITKKVVENMLRQSERESGTSDFMDQRRWRQLAWNDDRLSFQEFMYGFAQWLGLLEDEDDFSSVWSSSLSQSQRPLLAVDDINPTATAAADESKTVAVAGKEVA